MRIIHCSDIHLSHATHWRSLRGKQWAGAANWLLLRRFQHRMERWPRFLEMLSSNPPEALLCTGDLAQTGQAGELEAAAEPLRRLADRGVRVLYVPGNHDRYIRDPRAEEMVQKLCAEFGGGTEAAAGVVIAQTGEVEWILLRQAQPRGWISSAGAMAEPQWEALKRLSARPGNALRIVAGHFPLCNEKGRVLGRRRALAGAARLRLLLPALRARFYLCGHIHSAFSCALGEECEEICAGSLTAGGRYAEIEIRAGKAAWRWEETKC